MSAVFSRRVALGLALLLAIGLVWWDARSSAEQAAAGAVPAAYRSAGTALPQASSPGAKPWLVDRERWLAQESVDIPVTDLFGELAAPQPEAVSLAPPPVHAAAPAMPPVQAPPPVTAETPAPPPLVYMGKQRFGNEAWQVYLLAGEELVVARQGELLLGRYRVERIAPPVLRLRTVPDDSTTNIEIGEAP